MMKLLLAIALVASASAYGSCDTCKTASKATDEAGYCAYEALNACGCGDCNAVKDANGDGPVDIFRAGCGIATNCADAKTRRLTETTDLEEATTATAQWGRRRRRFFDSRRRRRRFFDYRRRRRRFFDARRRRRRAPPPHPCDTGNNGCSSSNAICIKTNARDWQCQCRGNYFCSHCCDVTSANFKNGYCGGPNNVGNNGHTCLPNTPYPTPRPTPRPTAYPTTFPTAFPTAYPTAYPTPAVCKKTFCKISGGVTNVYTSKKVHGITEKWDCRAASGAAHPGSGCVCLCDNAHSSKCTLTHTSAKSGKISTHHC